MLDQHAHTQAQGDNCQNDDNRFHIALITSLRNSRFNRRENAVQYATTRRKCQSCVARAGPASGLRAAHLAGAGAGGFGFGTTIAPPSCFSSTFGLKLGAAAGLGGPAMSFSAPFLAFLPLVPLPVLSRPPGAGRFSFYFEACA